MNLNQLRFATAVAQHRSFSRAAEQCHITQPSLSTAVAQLEQELGGRLFDRTTRQVELTPLGRDLLPLIGELLDAERAIRQAARRPAEGVRLVRVGFSPAVHLAPIHLALAAWRRDPGNPEVVLKECLHQDLHRRLEEGTLDLALVAELGQHSRQAVRLHDEPLMLVAARPRKAWEAGAPLKALAGETFAFTSGCGLADAVRQAFRRARVAIREYPGQALSYRVIEEWADLGLGSGILPRSKLSPGTPAVPVMHAGSRPLMLGTYAWRPRTQKSDSPAGRFLAWLQARTPALATGAVPGRGR
jgi:DNA-binding transcriptional LysR family regulator